MGAALVPLALVVLPGILLVVVLELLRWYGGGAPPRVLRPLRRPVCWALSRLRLLVDALVAAGLLTRVRSEPVPPVLLGLELRRLAAEVRRIEATDQPHRAARLAAALAAYDSVLVDLCRHAEVVTPVGLLPLDPRHRLNLEADLVATGMDW